MWVMDQEQMTGVPVVLRGSRGAQSQQEYSQRSSEQPNFT